MCFSKVGDPSGEDSCNMQETMWFPHASSLRNLPPKSKTSECYSWTLFGAVPEEQFQTVKLTRSQQLKQNPKQFASAGTLKSDEGWSDARNDLRDFPLACNRISGWMGRFQAIIEAAPERARRNHRQ